MLGWAMVRVLPFSPVVVISVKLQTPSIPFDCAATETLIAIARTTTRTNILMSGLLLRLWSSWDEIIYLKDARSLICDKGRQVKEKFE
jgi:hypothetical protein